MNALDYRRLGFDIYTFSDPAHRDDHRARLLLSGAEYEMHDVDETVLHTDLKFLAVKRTGLTFKQRIAARENKLGNFPKGD